MPTNICEIEKGELIDAQSIKSVPVDDSLIGDGKVLAYDEVNDKLIYVNQSGGGGGVSTFKELTDTPNSYTGQNGKIVSVKSTEDGLEFIDIPTPETVKGAFSIETSNSVVIPEDEYNIYYKVNIGSSAYTQVLPDVRNIEDGTVINFDNFSDSDIIIQPAVPGQTIDGGTQLDLFAGFRSALVSTTSGWRIYNFGAKGLSPSQIRGEVFPNIKAGVNVTIDRNGDNDITINSTGAGVSGIEILDENQSYGTVTKLKVTEPLIIGKSLTDPQEGILGILPDDPVQYLAYSEFPILLSPSPTSAEITDKVFFEDVYKKEGEIEVDLAQKDYILNNIAETGNTKYFISFRLSAITQIPFDTVTTFRVSLFDEDNNIILKDINGNSLLNVYTINVGSKAEDLFVEGIVEVSSQKRIGLRIAHNSKSGVIFGDTDNRSGIVIQEYSSTVKTSDSLIQNSIDVGSTPFIKELNFTAGDNFLIDIPKPASQSQTVVVDNYSKVIGELFVSTDSKNNEISYYLDSNGIHIKDDSGIPLTEVSQVISRSYCKLLGGKTADIKINLNPVSGYRVFVSKYNGDITQLISPRVFSKFVNDTPTYNTGFSQVSEFFISEDIVSGYKDYSFEFTFPANEELLFITIVNSGGSVSPNLFDIKSFNMATKETYNRYFIDRVDIRGVDSGTGSGITEQEAEQIANNVYNNNVPLTNVSAFVNDANYQQNNISDVNATALTGGGNTALHYHSSDRDRANHTGTQAASTISDFDTEVSNNTDVADSFKKSTDTMDNITDGTTYVKTENNYSDTDKTKVDIITTTGDGTQYLANDGTYKTVEGGGGGVTTSFIPFDFTYMLNSASQDYVKSIDGSPAGNKGQSFMVTDFGGGVFEFQGTYRITLDSTKTISSFGETFIIRIPIPISYDFVNGEKSNTPYNKGFIQDVSTGVIQGQATIYNSSGEMFIVAIHKIPKHLSGKTISSVMNPTAPYINFRLKYYRGDI